MTEQQSPKTQTLSADQFTFDEEGNLVIKDDAIVEALRNATSGAEAEASEEGGITATVTVQVGIT